VGGGKNIQTAESFLKRAFNKLNEARSSLENHYYAESVSASQECIELSVKAIFLLLQEEYPKRHEFKEEEFEAILKRSRRSLSIWNFPSFTFI
jgi:HEPN domain-containing protein